MYWHPLRDARIPLFNAFQHDSNYNPMGGYDKLDMDNWRETITPQAWNAIMYKLDQ